QYEDEEPVMYSEWELLGDGAAQWIMTAAAIVATILSWRAVRLLKGTLATNEELLRQGSKMHEESERAARAAENSNAIAREVGEAPVRAYPRIDLLSIFAVRRSNCLRICLVIANEGITSLQRGILIIQTFAG